jgi:hypothetical protein
MRVLLALPWLAISLGAFGCASASTVAPPVAPPNGPPPAAALFRPVAAALAKEKPAAAPAAVAKPGPRHEGTRPVYRLDFVLQDADSGPSTTGGTYTMNLEEDRPGELSIGSNVPLSPSNARQDVGLHIRASYIGVGDDLLLRSSFELSSTEDKGAIRKMTAQGDAVIAPGKRALVAGLDDPRGKQRYRLFATATKLR